MTLLHRVLALALMAGLAAPAPAQGAPEPEGTPEAPPLIVHEWGTFTSMVGSDGTGLEGLHHEEEALPGFVYRFGGEARGGRPLPPSTWRPKKLAVPLENVTQKMETPVVYFYTEAPMTVDLRVGFVGGLMTQWYPNVLDLAPRPKAVLGRGGVLDLEQVERSHLHWRVDLVPRAQGRPEEVPDVAAGHPWALARDVDAAWVRTRAPSCSREAEAYLFYRGLGTFSLPVTVEAGPGGAGRLVNGGADSLPAAFALEVRPWGARWAAIGPVRAGTPASLGLEGEPFRALEDVIPALKDRLQDHLVAHGLYEKEAVAMLRTWSRSWFESEGSRVLYLVPGPVVARLLPLRMSPLPDETVRVLVGRLEYITPEVEDAVTQALRDRATGIPALERRARDRLDRLGRFLEPHLRRVLETTPDERVRREARELLEADGPRTGGP